MSESARTSGRQATPPACPSPRRPRLAELERSPHGGDRSLAGEDLAWLGGLLQPRSDVDGVAADERAALARPSRDHLARVHSDAERTVRPRRRLRADAAWPGRCVTRARRDPRVPPEPRMQPSPHPRRTSRRFLRPPRSPRSLRRRTARAVPGPLGVLVHPRQPSSRRDPRRGPWRACARSGQARPKSGPEQAVSTLRGRVRHPFRQAPGRSR